MIDTAGLPKTSEKNNLLWRENRVALLLIHPDGSLEQSHLLAEKRWLLDECSPDDRLLAVRMMRFHPEVLVVDDLEPARSALTG